MLRYDQGTIGDLINHAGQRQMPPQILTGPVVQACLDDASGMINSAVHQRLMVSWQTPRRSASSTSE
jgi:hypothetical protein